MTISATIEASSAIDFYVVVDTDEWVAARTVDPGTDDTDTVARLQSILDGTYEKMQSLYDEGTYNNEKYPFGSTYSFRPSWSDAIKHFLSRKSVTSRGLYGEGGDSVDLFSPNHDNALSKDIAVYLFDWNDEHFVIVKDVDNYYDGYPTILRDDADDEAFWFSDDCYVIYCERCGAGWEYQSWNHFQASSHNHFDPEAAYDYHTVYPLEFGTGISHRDLPVRNPIPSILFCEKERALFHNCAGTTLVIANDGTRIVHNGGRIVAEGTEW